MVKFGYKYMGSDQKKILNIKKKKLRVLASEAGDFSGPFWQWRLESPRQPVRILLVQMAT